MAIPETERHKDYAFYAAHCLYLMTAATDPDASALQRKMADEWQRLANAIPRSFKPRN
jgi:hypothetical protein